MAVLVLEAGRARNEDLNEKLRRLSLITAQATQSLRVDKALDGILRHFVESLGATHGVVLLAGREPRSRLAPSASFGRLERKLSQRNAAVNSARTVDRGRFCSETNRYCRQRRRKPHLARLLWPGSQSQPVFLFAMPGKTRRWGCWLLARQALEDLKATRSISSLMSPTSWA